MASKRKTTTAIVAAVTAASLLLGGTFAWQSINQTALNEASDVINPGGRLHDDFDGSNKDVYVENFAEEDIFARIRLEEYFAIIANYDPDDPDAAQTVRNELVGEMNTDEDGNITYTYETHLFDVKDDAHDYWNWTTGGSTVYMPTFNKDKDSLKADVNGTYVDAVGGISNRGDAQYEDYTNWSEYEGENGTIGVGATKTDVAIYDADTDNLDNGGTTTVSEEHTAQSTLDATLISMADWMAMVEEYGSYNAADHGKYWVYDTDGWVYWAQAIEPGTATGLLLDKIELNQVMDDTWYYAINVVAQFVTADDVGKSDNTGFYAVTDEAPSTNAETLLEAIGVQMDGEAGDSSDSSDSGESGDSGDSSESGNEGDVTTPTITYGSMDMPYAIPSGTAINLGVQDYDGDASAITYYIIDYANNSELVQDEKGYFSTPLEAKDGVTVLALEGSYMGQPLTQYFYGKEIPSSEIASFSATDTSKLEAVTFVAATESDAGEIEIISEVTTKIYNSATHSYLGNASAEDNGWYLAFEALDESGNMTGSYCAASGTMISAELYELYPIATATWNEENQWYDITGISETACGGTHEPVVLELTATTTAMNFNNEARTNGVDLGLSATAGGATVAVSDMTLSVANSTSADTKVEDGKLILGADETATTMTLNAQYGDYTDSVDISVDYFSLACWKKNTHFDPDYMTVLGNNNNNTYDNTLSFTMLCQIYTHDGELLNLGEEAYAFNVQENGGTYAYTPLETANTDTDSANDGHAYVWIWLPDGYQMELTVTWEGRTETFTIINP